MILGSDVAEKLIQNFYNWISNPESKLYDPQLLELVNQITRKCFSMLVNWFKEMGANIIYAS